MSDLGQVLRLAGSFERGAVSVSMPAPLALSMWEAVTTLASITGERDGALLLWLAPPGVAPVERSQPVTAALLDLVRGVRESIQEQEG